MVAITLIEGGMSAEDAILFIRARRRGAINARFAFRLVSTHSSDKLPFSLITGAEALGRKEDVWFHDMHSSHLIIVTLLLKDDCCIDARFHNIYF
jgi:hypothetical protein